MPFGYLGAAGAGNAGFQGAQILEQVLARRQREEQGNKELALRERALASEEQMNALRRATGLLSIGLEDKAREVLGVSGGELQDPVYRDIAAKLLIQRLQAPENIGQGVARELFPPPELGEDNPVGQAMSRLLGRRGSPSATSQGAEALGGGLGLGGQPITLGQARQQVPSAPETEIGMNPRMKMAMDFLLAGKDSSKVTHPLETAASRYIDDVAAGKPGNELDKQAFETLIKSKGASAEALSMKLDATVGKLQNLQAEMEFKFKKLEEVDKPRVGLEARRTAADESNAAARQREASVKEKEARTKETEVSRKSDEDFAQRVEKARDQFIRESNTAISADQKAEVKRRQQTSLTEIYDREIARYKSEGRDTAQLEAQKRKAVGSFRPALKPGEVPRLF